MKNIRKMILPKIGMRIIKTALAVLITLLVTDLLFVRVLQLANFVSVFAVVSAVLTIQDSIKSSFSSAFERCVGTLIGVAVGMMFLTFDLLLKKNIYSFYTFITLGTILVIYGCKVVKKASASSLCVVVFIAVLFSRDEASPYLAAGVRVLETVIGVVVALLVNVIVFPPKSRKIGECMPPSCNQGKLNEAILNISELKPDMEEDISADIYPDELILINKNAFGGNKGGKSKRYSGGYDEVVEMSYDEFVKAIGIEECELSPTADLMLEEYNLDEERAVEQACHEISKLTTR